MCGGWRYGRWQDAPHLRPRLQQKSFPRPAAQHSRAHRLGHRSVPHLQRGKSNHHRHQTTIPLQGFICQFNLKFEFST